MSSTRPLPSQKYREARAWVDQLGLFLDQGKAVVQELVIALSSQVDTDGKPWEVADQMWSEAGHGALYDPRTKMEGSYIPGKGWDPAFLPRYILLGRIQVAMWRLLGKKIAHRRPWLENRKVRWCASHDVEWTAEEEPPGFDPPCVEVWVDIGPAEPRYEPIPDNPLRGLRYRKGRR